MINTYIIIIIRRLLLLLPPSNYYSVKSQLTVDYHQHCIYDSDCHMYNMEQSCNAMRSIIKTYKLACDCLKILCGAFLCKNIYYENNHYCYYDSQNHEDNYSSGYHYDNYWS